MQETEEFGSPAWVTYLIPFQIIRPDNSPPYSVTLDEINHNKYDHGALSKVVATITEPELENMALLVCLDGGLALPAIAPYEHVEKAIERFNRVLCAFLLGGIEVEAIDSRHVVSGSLHKRTYIWPVNDGLSLDAHLHAGLRTRVASSFDSIVLHEPRNTEVSHLIAAYRSGAAILEAIDNLSPTFLLRGHTELKYENWSNALANLWIAVEQITDHLWENTFLQDPKIQLKGLPKRLKSLREDSRTWTLLVRQEMLWQVGILPSQSYELLFPARQARNNLIHEGAVPNSDVVRGLYEAVLQLIETICKTKPLGIRAMDIGTESQPVEKRILSSFKDWVILSEEFHNAGRSET